MKNQYISLIKNQVEKGIWPGYVHCYPHKKAYRHIEFDMQDAWHDCSEMNIYVHVPFCDRKCSFCNLFSYAIYEDQIIEQYTNTICKQIDYYHSFMTDIKIKSIYFGGGTPNILSSHQLNIIMEKLKKSFQKWDKDIEPCLEASPDKLDKEYISDLRDMGFKRVSIGVQSFKLKELISINRDYDINISTVIDNLKQYNMNINIDLIYGLPGQEKFDAISNLRNAIEYYPQSISIYPLAIRELTGLHNIKKEIIMSSKKKYELFDELREVLEENGYKCETVVRFINSTSTYQQQRFEFVGIPTLGVGAGARSYAKKIHYCLPYKIDHLKIKKIVQNYIYTDFSKIEYDGFLFDVDEMKRKFVILNLLDPGLNSDIYYKNFGTNLFDEFNDELTALMEIGFIQESNHIFTLTRNGRKYCDIAVSIFESRNIQNLYKEYKAE